MAAIETLNHVTKKFTYENVPSYFFRTDLQGFITIAWILFKLEKFEIGACTLSSPPPPKAK